MNTVKISLGCGILVASLLVFNTVFAADEEAKAKHTIKEVMKIAHKDGLLKKVLGGDASQDEKLVLLDSYISLMENKPQGRRGVLAQSGRSGCHSSSESCRRSRRYC